MLLQIRDTFFHANFVGFALGTSPPLAAFSIHAPNLESGEDQELGDTIGRLEGALSNWQRAFLGVRILLGVDLNGQVSRVKRRIGPGAMGERIAEEERADVFNGLLNSYDLMLASTFSHA